MVVPLLVTATLLLVANLLVVLVLLKGRGDRAEAAELLKAELRASREEAASAASTLRQEVSGAQQKNTETLVKTFSEIGGTLQKTVDGRLQELRSSNEKKLDQMREVVDEKLQSTLEKRLGESFKLVGDRLEAVQQGLGEMRSLASGVGDLKKVLTNVKTRGTWGEVQLGALLEQVLTPEQFERNVKPRPDSRDIVEFAIRLPGASDDPEQADRSVEDALGAWVPWRRT